MNEVIFLTVFLVFVAFMLFLDLGVFHKKDAEVTTKEAAIWTSIWIGCALLFYLFLLFFGDLLHGPGVDKNALSLEYLTGYVIEKSLSIDNVFVMLLLFASFNIERKYYHRVLYYGILGAVILRFIFIFAASALIERFDWILLVFGAILLVTGIKMFFTKENKEKDAKSHPLVKFFTKRNMVTEPNGHDFFKKVNGKWLMTPLFLVLIMVELSDIVFAFDSIPAIFSVTTDPYIVFFSNIFAILGLRSLFFLIENMMQKFEYLTVGLAVLLAFIGSKMIVHYVWHIAMPTAISLLVILGILTLSIVASIIKNKRNVNKC